MASSLSFFEANLDNFFIHVAIFPDNFGITQLGNFFKNCLTVTYASAFLLHIHNVIHHRHIDLSFHSFTGIISFLLRSVAAQYQNHCEQLSTTEDLVLSCFWNFSFITRFVILNLYSYYIGPMTFKLFFYISLSAVILTSISSMLAVIKSCRPYGAGKRIQVSTFVSGVFTVNMA